MGRLGDQGQGGLLAGGLQYLATLVAEGQHSNVGRRGFGLLPGDAQPGAEYHSPDAGQGIALGFGLGADIFYRAPFADGFQQPVVQTLIGVGQSGKLIGGQTHQCTQHGVFQAVFFDERLSLVHGLLQDGCCAFGQIGKCFVKLTFPQQLPDVGCRGVFALCALVVTGTHTGDGEDVHPGLPADQRLAVFDGKNVVGLLQNFGPFLDPRIQRPLPGGGVGNAGFQMEQSVLHRLMFQQQGSGLLEQFRIGVLRTEAQVGEHAGTQQDIHCTLCKAFGRPQGIGGRQLQHHIGTAQNGGLCPQMLGQNGGITTLHKIRGHTANHCTILTQSSLCRRNLVGVSFVKGIIFRNNAANPHKNLQNGCQNQINGVKYIAVSIVSQNSE